MSRRLTKQQQTVLSKIYAFLCVELENHSLELDRRLWETRGVEEQPFAEVLQHILPDTLEVLGIKVTLQLLDVKELQRCLEPTEEATPEKFTAPRGGPLYPQDSD